MTSMLMATAVTIFKKEWSSMRRRQLAGVTAIMLSIVVAGTAAQAQEAESATGRPAEPNQDRFVVGLGVSAAPTYQGSGDYRILPIPLIDIVKGPFFANLRNGIGIQVIDTGAFTMGGSVAIMPGFRRHDVPQGIDRVSIGAGGRLFATLKLAGANFTVGATQGIAGSTGGVIADASASYPVVATPRIVLIPSLGATWGDKRHNDEYFGINGREAEESGLPRYRLGKGFKDVSASLTAIYWLGSRMSMSATTGMSALVGDAKHSPLVDKTVQPSGFLTLAYRMGH